jgi:diguanylate cyclase (GGDEF)-like protein/PAS domain S-box-containing protein
LDQDLRRATDHTTHLGEERFRLLLDHAPCALVTVDAAGRIVLVNARAEELFGYRRHELIGGAADRLLLGEAAWQGGAPPAASELALNAKRKDGSEFPVEISFNRIRTVDGWLTSVAVRDLTEHETLAHRANHDPLTGLPNRSLFLDRLEHALARTLRSGTRLAVLFLDLDDFKVVNDTGGHDVGDLVLRTLALRLSAALRPGDTIARFGGDEFVVLCEDLADEHAAVGIAERLTAACSRPVTTGDQEHVVTVSAGIALLRDGRRDSAADLLKNADAAMYRAKAGGAGAIVVWG